MCSIQVFQLFLLKFQPTDWEAADGSLECDRSVGEVDWALPGTVAGLKMLESFIKERLKYFGGNRNDPTKPVLSNMSPWYHFGECFVLDLVPVLFSFYNKPKLHDVEFHMF